MLYGAWNFLGHPGWPPYFIRLRDGAVLVFTIAALVWFAGAARMELRRWRARSAQSTKYEAYAAAHRQARDP